jgi:hypothetical protein
MRNAIFGAILLLPAKPVAGKYDHGRAIAKAAAAAGYARAATVLAGK